MTPRDRVKAALARKGIGFVEKTASILCLDKHETTVHFSPEGRLAGARGSRSIIKLVRAAAISPEILAAASDPRLFAAATGREITGATATGYRSRRRK